ncbi:MAG: hypothetical protein E6L07_13725, partial [Verrucomicrobia bacterium]
MAEDRQAGARTPRRWWRRAATALALCVALLALFHRPLLLGLGRQLALRYATGENLKANFRLEGNPFTNLTVRNFHAFPTGPSAVESIDIDYLYVDYSLLGLARHGLSHFLDNIETRSARIVLNPSKDRPRAHPPKKKATLPTLFPERVRLTDATLIIRNQPHDFVAEHVDLDLNPRSPGDVRIDKLQLPAGDGWSKISARASYTNKNFILRDLGLSDQEQIHLLNVDASHIDTKTLAVNLDCAVGGGRLSASATFSETTTSLTTKIHVAAETIAAESLNKYVDLPEEYISGKIERVTVDGTGVLNVPRTWSGTMFMQMSDLHRQEIGLDSCVLELSAAQGRATLRAADFVQGKNEFHLRGTADLPSDLKEFGRSPATLEIAGTTLDLQRLTAGTPQPLTGSAQLNGKIDIENGKLEANLSVSAGSIGFKDGTIEKLSVNLGASKIAPPPDAKKSWFADLRTVMNVAISNIRYRDYVVDSVEGSLGGIDDIVKLERLNLRRNQNELNIHGRYRLPEEIGKAASQPAELDVSLNAPEAGDFWASDSPDKITGPLQMAAQFEWKQQTANGQLSIFGSNLRMRDLVFNQLSSQCSISNNVIYLNDCTASLNEADFVNAIGILNLRPPYHYSGKASAHVS